MNTDEKLQLHVLEELDWEPNVDASRIGVTAENAIVTLTGHVPVYAERQAAEDSARRVHGVKGVANEIEVIPSDSHQREDAELAAAAVHAVEWDAKVPHDRIQATVKDGWITLEGTVDRRHEKVAAYRAVRHLKGVRGITNAIQISHTMPTAEIQAGIEAALRRSAALNAQRLAVRIDDRKVFLEGEVRCHLERDEAERIAWSASGVDEVVNCISITPWGTGPAEEWGY
jgi:osmotically-inducible protein OsmY